MVSYHFVPYRFLSYRIVSYHIVSYRIVSYPMVSYRFVPYRIVSHRTVSYRIISYGIISFRTVSFLIVPYRIVSYRIVSYRIISYGIISLRTISYRIVSYRIVSYRMVWYSFVPYRILSYRIVSYRIVSYYVVAYHIISYHIESHSTISYRNVVGHGSEAQLSLDEKLNYCDWRYSAVISYLVLLGPGILYNITVISARDTAASLWLMSERGCLISQLYHGALLADLRVVSRNLTGWPFKNDTLGYWWTIVYAVGPTSPNVSCLLCVVSPGPLRVGGAILGLPHDPRGATRAAGSIPLSGFACNIAHPTAGVVLMTTLGHPPPFPWVCDIFHWSQPRYRLHLPKKQVQYSPLNTRR